ncbi:unnamed protein product, partial [Polarella glacialis]
MSVGEVVKHSDISVLFVFFWIYSLSIVSFSMFVSSFFSRAKVAAAVAGLAYWVAYMPYSVFNRFEERTGSQRAEHAHLLGCGTCMSKGYPLCFFIHGAELHSDSTAVLTSEMLLASEARELASHRANFKRVSGRICIRAFAAIWEKDCACSLSWSAVGSMADFADAGWELPDWHLPAAEGWWRVVHHPLVYAMALPIEPLLPDNAGIHLESYTKLCLLSGRDPADVYQLHVVGEVLAMVEKKWDSEQCCHWLRLRDRGSFGEQWIREGGESLGLGRFLELLPTGCDPPSPAHRASHERALQEVLAVRGAFSTGASSAAVRLSAAVPRLSRREALAGCPTAPHGCAAARELLNKDGGAAVGRLLRHGYVVFQDALPDAGAFVEQMARLDNGWNLRPAPQATAGQRGDRLVWIDETLAVDRYGVPVVGAAIAFLKGLADALNPALTQHHRERMLRGDPVHASSPLEPATVEQVLTVSPHAQAASYPGEGTRYIPHQDNRFRPSSGDRLNSRELTAILYANPPDWDVATDGGALQLYLHSEDCEDVPHSSVDPDLCEEEDSPRRQLVTPAGPAFTQDAACPDSLDFAARKSSQLDPNSLLTLGPWLVALPVPARSLAANATAVALACCLFVGWSVIFAAQLPFLRVSEGRNPVVQSCSAAAASVFDAVHRGMLQPPITSTGASPSNDHSLFSVWLMLLMDIILYQVLAWYIEKVCPGTLGLPQPWYFPLQPSYWRPASTSTEELASLQLGENGGAEQGDNDLLECWEAPSGGVSVPPSVQLKNLSKTFAGGKQALRGISLDLYPGTIVGLLGHNGAGKSTTMAILTGLYPPTGGDVLVHGVSVRSDSIGVRRQLGVCLQHNALYENITVEEHLRLFCCLKSVPQKQVQSEVDALLRDTGLTPKRHAPSRALSGGMKRKLSIGIALAGGSRVVTLDEPTAGVDATSRRDIWHLLVKSKANRTILLSTHFMDEADILSDRIAIIAEGKLTAIASSMALKRHFADGYMLTVVCADDADIGKLGEVVYGAVPNASFAGARGQEFCYVLPFSGRSQFPVLFANLQDQQVRAELKIETYGLSAASMEEVFLKASSVHEKGLHGQVRNGSLDLGSGMAGKSDADSTPVGGDAAAAIVLSRPNDTPWSTTPAAGLPSPFVGPTARCEDPSTPEKGRATFPQVGKDTAKGTASEFGATPTVLGMPLNPCDDEQEPPPMSPQCMGDGGSSSDFGQELKELPKKPKATAASFPEHALLQSSFLGL